MSQTYAQTHQPTQDAQQGYSSFSQQQYVYPGSQSGHQYGALPTYNQAFRGNGGTPGGYPGDEDDDFKYGVSVAQCEVEIRMAFIRKVYTILATQLGATVLVGSLFFFNEQARNWVQSNQWASLVSIFGALGVMLVLFWKRHSSPLNFYLLGAFTLLEAYSVGTIVTFYSARVVLQALIITFALFIGLTLFTMQSKYDFSGMGSILNIVLWLVVIASLVQIFFPFSSKVDFAIAIVVALLFCGYIVYDTYMIINRLSPDEYIVASIDLYLDILNLFLAILRILNELTSDS
ncbi:hypothetical protein K7432_014753 [Basidiobolus ranarum]|uniref:Uncharacterized protein n=1 Tax=Basidiobolus ranarum TaxID=34480 RepID=A0ABR2VP10_9FUNG